MLEHEGNDLIKEEMLHLAKVFADAMGIKNGTRRMDSVMVASSTQKLSRVRLMCPLYPKKKP